MSYSAPIDIAQRLPWQNAQWQQLLKTVPARLPHALLLSGARGLGKVHFAEQLAYLLLCQAPQLSEGKACQQCQACHLLQAGTHPDLIWVRPQQDGQSIKIEQIRQLVYQAGHTALMGGRQIFVLEPAHALNQAAANALLKTLEEPAPHIVIVLISEFSQQIPATIRSRCQQLHFSKPSTAQALAFLQMQTVPKDAVDLSLILALAEGAPLKALALMQEEHWQLREALYQGLHHLSVNKADPLALAAEWQETDIVQLLEFLLSYLRDLMRLGIAGAPDSIINRDYHAMLSELAPRFTKQHLLQYLTLVQERYVQWQQWHSVNRQLLLEELLIKWKIYSSYPKIRDFNSQLARN